MKLEILERNIKMSSRDYVYETLRTNIISLKLPPGSSIAENDVSELLKVSRTPIREAFVKLSEEELIEIYPQRGSFVSRIDLQQIAEARFVRETMEVEISKLACDIFTEDDLEDIHAIIIKQTTYNNRKNYDKLIELDEEFHRTLFEKCGKHRTWLLVQQMQTHYKRLRQLLLSVNLRWDLIIEQHQSIYELIREKDKDLLEQAIRNHLKLFVLVRSEELKEKYPGYLK